MIIYCSRLLQYYNSCYVVMELVILHIMATHMVVRMINWDMNILGGIWYPCVTTEYFHLCRGRGAHFPQFSHSRWSPSHCVPHCSRRFPWPSEAAFGMVQRTVENIGMWEVKFHKLLLRIHSILIVNYYLKIKERAYSLLMFWSKISGKKNTVPLPPERLFKITI